VRYCDANGVFSTYSTPTWFETDPLLTSPPVAGSDIYEVPPGGVLDVAAPGVLINDTDADGDPLTAVKLSDPAEGLLTLHADGSFMYTPATNWSGADSFTYCASDGTTNSPGVLCQLVAADMGTQAMMVCEYFSYGVTGGSFAGMSTFDTVGWASNRWSGSTSPEYRPFSAAFISAAGEAQAYSNRLAGGCLRGANSEAGTVTRGLSPPLDGTVWVSLVVTCSWWNSPPDLSKNHAQVVINGRNADRFGVMTSGSSTRQRLLVYENGVMFTNDVVGAGSGRSALLVARLRTNVSGTDDELTAWLFPDGGALPDGRALTNLGAPLYTTSGAQDLWGDTIASVGLTIMSQSDTREIYVDSLRVSYGDIADDAHVHKVLAGEAIPEPLGAMGAVCALWSASMFRRRRI
jgi:hypothetical protein